MSDTYSQATKARRVEQGAYSGEPEAAEIFNSGAIDVLDANIGGVIEIDIGSDTIYFMDPMENGEVTESHYYHLIFIGTPSAAVTVIVHASVAPSKDYLVENLTGQLLTFRYMATDGVNVPDGMTALVKCNGTDVRQYVAGEVENPITEEEIAAGITPYDSSYWDGDFDPGDIRRYGPVDRTGLVDSSTAINNAIAVNNIVVFPSGNIRWDTKPTLAAQVSLKLRGKGSERTSLWVKNQTGKTFTIADSAPMLRIDVEGLTVDGSNGIPASGSTTWTGFISVTKTTGVGFRFFYTDDFHVKGSAAVGAVALDIGTSYFTDICRTYITAFIHGFGVKAGQYAGFTSTTVTLTKSYIQGCRQGYEIGPALTDFTFNDCVLESCTVGGHATLCKVVFNGGYCENIGADPAGLTRGGITKMSAAQSFGNALDTTDVDCGFTQLYGQLHFNAYRFSALGANCTAYIHGIGEGGGTGADGAVWLRGGSNDESTKGLFRDELGGGVTERNNFAYMVDDPIYGAASVNGVMNLYSDARKVTAGWWSVPFPSSTRRLAKILRGKFEYGHGLEDTYSAGLADQPSGGQNIVGDSVIFTTPAAAGWRGSVVTTAGSPGTWKRYGEIEA